MASREIVLVSTTTIPDLSMVSAENTVNLANLVSLVNLVNTESTENPECTTNTANPANAVNLANLVKTIAEAREGRAEVTAVESEAGTVGRNALTAVATSLEEIVAAEVKDPAAVEAECRTLTPPSLRTDDSSTDLVGVPSE